tara:strand:- start:217 stop:492 length:276 start_codon:yes stop_codon:yes gene_type:complete
MKKTITKTFYSDPGHAWLKVDITDLVDLGLERSITAHSYRRGSSVFLEEDQDATAFIKRHQQKYPNYQLKFNGRHTDLRSKIRSYSPYIGS